MNHNGNNIESRLWAVADELNNIKEENPDLKDGLTYLTSGEVNMSKLDITITDEVAA